jgi:hypothetical protein
VSLRDSDSPGVKALWSCYAENSLLARLVESVLCLAFCDKLNWRIDSDQNSQWGRSLHQAGIGHTKWSNDNCLRLWLRGIPVSKLRFPEIEFDDSSGKTLLRKDAVYEIRHVYPEFSRAAFAEVSRSVTFSVTVTLSAPVELVVVRNHSAGE